MTTHVELQLALALPSSFKPSVFDLNSGIDKDDDSVSDSDSSTITDHITNYNYRKRTFDDAFAPPRPPTLPLFMISWNKRPRDDDDDDGHDDHPRDHHHYNFSFSSSNKSSDDDGVVGWPPIKNWRKKFCNQLQRHGGGGRGRVIKNNQTVMRNGSSTYVKVKMEGVAIARKIDLSLYTCLETLTNTLIAMFGFWRHEHDSNNYKLTYQDREGDWLIAQDVPWRTFIRTAQRLKLSKSSWRLMNPLTL